LSKVERQVVKLDDRERALHTELAEAATDAARLHSLGAELKAVRAEKEIAELRWMELAEALG
ncbi:MAG: ABC transporter ATP-binding protein, partial [Mycobacteriaceae bacterium]